MKSSLKRSFRVMVRRNEHIGGKSIKSVTGLDEGILALSGEPIESSAKFTTGIEWIPAESFRKTRKGESINIHLGLRGELLPGFNSKGLVAVTGEYMAIKLIRQSNVICVNIAKKYPSSFEEKIIFHVGGVHTVTLPRGLTKYQSAIDAGVEKLRSAEKKDLCFYSK